MRAGEGEAEGRDERIRLRKKRKERRKKGRDLKEKIRALLRGGGEDLRNDENRGGWLQDARG